MRFKSFLLAIIFSPLLLFSQEIDYGNSVEAADLCVSFKSNSFSSNYDADEALEKISHLAGQRLDHHLHNPYYTFTNHDINSIDTTNPTGLNYIYPMILYNCDLFYKYPTITIDYRILQLVYNGRCKICFIQSTEGFIGYDDHHYVWLNKLSSKYGLTNENFIIITANLHAPKRFKELIDNNSIANNFKIIPYNHFGDNLWFSSDGNVLYGSSKKNETPWSCPLETGQDKRVL